MKKIKTLIAIVINFFEALVYDLTNLYFIILKKVIPCKIITIEFVNPIDQDKKLYGTIIAKIGTPHISLDDVLDSVFKMSKRFLVTEKNIHNFSGLEIKTPQGKYQIFYMGTGYTTETNPARNTNKEIKNLNQKREK